VEFRAAFKPVSSIAKPQKTIGRDGKEWDLAVEGRHDVCIVPRAVPVVEAMTALVLADLLLLSRLSRLEGLVGEQP
jgi:chorismate synthase